VLTPPERRKVLIVDDEVNIANTLAIVFNRAGYESKATLSSEEALRWLFADGWKPDFAILDVYMPGIQGIELAILLHAKYPNCIITLFSGHPASEALVKSAQQDGHFFDLLAKPVHPDELLDLAGLAARAQEPPLTAADAPIQ
jgi:DNA-binding NtrC family response regulator